MNDVASIWPPPTVGEVNAKRLDGEAATVVGSAMVILAELAQAVITAAAVINETARRTRLRRKALLIRATLLTHV